MVIQQQFHIESSRQTCCQCRREFLPTEEYVSGLLEVDADEVHPHGLARMDYCPDHWSQDSRPWLAFWRTCVPEPEEPTTKRIVIDDDRLLEVFFRLAETRDPLRLDLRYVIGLMLMRKRRLKSEGTRRHGDEAFLRVRKTRSKEIHELLDRQLSDAAILGVSREIGTLLDLADMDEGEEPSDEG